jgi:hypothetical protein
MFSLYLNQPTYDRAAVQPMRDELIAAGFREMLSLADVDEFKNGGITFMMQKYDIEGKTAQMVAGELAEAFNNLCTKQGPSIPPEEYANLVHAIACGSKIPLAKG